MVTMRLEICRKVGFCAAWTMVLSFACFVQSEVAFQGSLDVRHRKAYERYRLRSSKD